MTELLNRLIQDPYITEITYKYLVIPVLNSDAVQDQLNNQAADIATQTVNNVQVR